MCVGMKGFGLSKVSWLQWVMLTTSRLHPLHLISKYVCALALLWDIGSICEGSGWPEFHPGRGKRQTNWKPVFGVASSDCVAASDQFWFLSATAEGDAAFPWRMQRKRVWLGFIFMTYHFFAGKHSAQTSPLQAHAQASQRQRERKHVRNERTPWLNTSVQSKVVFPAQTPNGNQNAVEWLSWQSFNSPFWVFCCLEFSRSFCASIIIFLNRRVLRSEVLRCLTKGKGASPSASKTLVRPKREPFFSFCYVCKCLFVVGAVFL